MAGQNLVKMWALFLVTLTILLGLTVETEARRMRCPGYGVMTPCSCHNTTGQLGEPVVEISCVLQSDHVWSQDDVVNALKIIREVNNVSDSERLELYKFEIRRTSMTWIDLTPFVNVDVGNMILDGGPKRLIDRIILPPLNETTRGSINVEFLEILYTKLDDQAYGETLRYFNASRMGALRLEFQNLEGSARPGANNTDFEANPEFLPGLSAFTQLDWLGLGFNKIRVLKGGQFQNQGKLEFLNLHANPIQEIGDDAFLFRDPTDNADYLKDRWIYTTMDYINLTEGAFSPGFGRPKNLRPVELNMQENKFVTIPQAAFEAYLEAHVANRFSVLFNPIWCDERVSWLKARRAEFQVKVGGAVCENDPGRTLFESPLVP